MLSMTINCFQFGKMRDANTGDLNTGDLWKLILESTLGCSAASVLGFCCQNPWEISSVSLGQGGCYLHLLLGIKSSPESWQLCSSSAVKERWCSQVSPPPWPLLPLTAPSQALVGAVSVSSPSAEHRNASSLMLSKQYTLSAQASTLGTNIHSLQGWTQAYSRCTILWLESWHPNVQRVYGTWVCITE